MTEPRRQLDALLSALLDDGLEAGGRDELNALLSRDLAACDTYLDQIILQAHLQQQFSRADIAQRFDVGDWLDEDGADLLGEALTMEDEAKDRRARESAEELVKHDAEQLQREQHLTRLFGVDRQPIKPVKRIVIPKAMFYGVIAAVVALTAMLFWPNQSPPPQVVEEKPTAPQFVQVAKLVEQIDAKWLAPGNSDPAPGDVLLNQPMHLTSGLAKIRFNNEAEVILEAPCSIEPISGGEIKIMYGKLVGKCETVASRGFVVQTPGARIVDQGTEFGVSVDLHGIAQAHVFEGEIELTATKNNQPTILMRGGARQVDAAGTSVSTIETDELTFVRENEFEANRLADQSERHRWIAARHRLLRDVDVLAHIPFVPPQADWPAGLGYLRKRVVINDQTDPVNAPLDTAAYAESVAWRNDAGFGQAVQTDGQTPIFIDLDVNRNGVFDRAGLLDSEGLIGASGATLYIAWRMQGPGKKLVTDNFVGLSLMHGDRRLKDEPLFLGKAVYTNAWSIHSRDLTTVVNNKIPLNDVASPPDDDSHLWLVQIDFVDGPDRIRIYLDPDLNRDLSSQANATVNDVNLAFDRLRLISGEGAQNWRFDEIAITRSIRALRRGVGKPNHDSLEE